MGPFNTLLSQDLLLLPLLHCEGPHSPNIAKGLVCYTCRPGNLHGDREIGSSCRQEEAEGRARRMGQRCWEEPRRTSQEFQYLLLTLARQLSEA